MALFSDQPHDGAEGAGGVVLKVCSTEKVTPPWPFPPASQDH